MSFEHEHFQAIDLDSPERRQAPRTIGFRRVPCEEPTAKDTMTGIGGVGQYEPQWRWSGWDSGYQDPYSGPSPR
jgi:hypothetical protein